MNTQDAEQETRDAGVVGQAFSPLTRRRFLKISLGGLGLLGGSALGLAYWRGSVEPVSGLRCLSEREYWTVAAAAEAHIPRGGAFEAGAADLDLARIFDGYLADEPAEVQSLLKQAILLVELGPVLFDRRMSTFLNLNLADHETHWAGWASSDNLTRRQVSLGFGKVFTLSFYDSETAWKAIGYPGPPLGSASS